jgi:hypothetical protein
VIDPGPFVILTFGPATSWPSAGGFPVEPIRI